MLVMATGTGKTFTAFHFLEPYKVARTNIDGTSTIGNRTSERLTLTSKIFPTIEPDASPPIIATTAELLSTGVDCKIAPQFGETVVGFACETDNFLTSTPNYLLQTAITGQLTQQLPTDNDARDLPQKIRADKPLPPTAVDDIPDVEFAVFR